MRKQVWLVAVEALAVSVLGLGVGLTANAMNSMGLDIRRNYFRPRALPSPATGDPQGPALVAALPTEDSYPKIEHGELFELFQSDCYLDERCVFVDARDDDHYTEGHIPGAYQLDHYRVDRYIDELRPACQNAERIVVYCNGGKCEDSILAADDLLEEGIEPHKIVVYGGGISAWKADNLPVERGARHSNDLIYLED